MANPYIKKIANKAYQHFIVEEKPFSYSESSGNCYYRMKGGAKCAIGIFIPDEMYSPAMEGCDVFTVFDKFPQFLEFMTKEGFLPSLYDPCFDDAANFIKHLQTMHDVHATYVDNLDAKYDFGNFLRSISNEDPKDYARTSWFRQVYLCP